MTALEQINHVIASERGEDPKKGQRDFEELIRLGMVGFGSVTSGGVLRGRVSCGAVGSGYAGPSAAWSGMVRLSRVTYCSAMHG